MQKDSKNNTVKFLLDGLEFFDELASKLNLMMYSKPNPRSYVRLAFWAASADVVIDRSAKATLATLLKKVADAGYVVQVILWDANPGLLPRAKKLLEQMPNAAFAQALDGYVGGSQKGNQGKIEVFLESYRGWVAATSTHQKIAIFADDGRLTTIIGGFNLEKSYWDTLSHTLHTESGGWHDTAVLIEGPATVDIEQEWLRRWRKRYGTRKQPTLPQATLNDQSSSSDAPVSITILTTNSESLVRETHLRDQLCADIAKAKRYVYIENYGLSDPALVTALRRRLAENTELRVVVMVSKLDHKGEQNDPFNYLTRVAYSKLLIGAGGTLTVNQQELRPEACAEWGLIEDESRDPTNRSVKAMITNQWFEDDRFHYRASKDSKRILVALKDIAKGTSSRVGFYCPRRIKPIYVHSKLAIIDDAIAYIGSANFTYRSMAYDGELSARIYGNDAVVKAIRSDLFLHYGLYYDDAEDLQKNFNRYTQAFSARYKSQQVLITDIELSDLPTTVAQDKILNYTVY